MRPDRSPRSSLRVLMLPLATWPSLAPSQSMTRKPVIWRPGSMPRMRRAMVSVARARSIEAEWPRGEGSEGIQRSVT